MLILASFAHSATPVEPAVGCDKGEIPPGYYGIISVNMNGTDDPVSPIAMAGVGCGYVNTLTTDKSKACDAVGGDLPVAGNYKVTTIPACSGSVERMVAAGKDIFGGLIESRRKLEVAGCPGEISGYSSEIDFETTEITITSFIRNTGSGSCTYYIELYGLTSPNLDPNVDSNWVLRTTSSSVAVASGDTAKIVVSSKTEGLLASIIAFLTFSNWDASTLNGQMKIELRNSGGEIVDKIQDAVCQDNVLVLCESNRTNTIIPLLGGTEAVYGVVYQSNYLNLADYSVDDYKDKHWLLNQKDNTVMHQEDCTKTVGQELRETKFYTVLNNEKYNKFVEKKFGDEEFYIKYAELYGKNTSNGFYCYKTEIRDTSKCTEVNKLWYSFPTNTNGDLNRFMFPSYIHNMSAWNAHQNLTELLDLKATLPSPGAMSNVGSETFMISPLLQDIDGNSPWTSTPNGSFFGMSGFERKNTCELSCDAKRGCHVLGGCTDAGGKPSTACDTCDVNKTDYTSDQCTMDDTVNCAGNMNDCHNRICKQVTLPYDLETQPDTTMYGIPLTVATPVGLCPTGFGYQRIHVRFEAYIQKNKYLFYGNVGGLTAEVQQYCNGISASQNLHNCTAVNVLNEEWACDCDQCVLSGGVVGKTNFMFEKSNEVDVAVVVDSTMSGSVGTLCAQLDSAVAAAKLNNGVTATYTVYAIREGASTSIGDCNNVKSINCSTMSQDLDGYIECPDCLNKDCQESNWGTGVIWAARKHEWRENTERKIIPISDRDADCGNSGGDGELRVNQSISAALTSGAMVYGLSGGLTAQNQMLKISQGTSPTAFSVPYGMAGAFLTAIMSDTPDASYTVTNGNPVTAQALNADNTMWGIYQVASESVNYKAQAFKLAPALNITVTGNMPFTIPYVRFGRDPTNPARYTLITLYAPTSATNRLEIVSDINLNYSLTDNAPKYGIIMNSTYVTNWRRDEYTVSCWDKLCSCQCNGCGNTAIYNYQLLHGPTPSCGGESELWQCGCFYAGSPSCCVGCVGPPGCSDAAAFDPTDIYCSGHWVGYTQEVRTVNQTLEYSDIDKIYIPQVSNEDVCENTLENLEISGTFYSSVDKDGTLTVYNSPEDPLKITIAPDILSGFSLDVNRSYIVYQRTVFPVKHDLISPPSSAGITIDLSQLGDKYGYNSIDFLPEQCNKTCPAEPLCTCSTDAANYPLNPRCLNYDASFVSRTDCACTAAGCYPDPCVSLRDFHEWEGSTVANGNFERDFTLPNADSIWRKNPFLSNVAMDYPGYTGKMLHFKGLNFALAPGKVEQTIPSLHASPYKQACVLYAIDIDTSNHYTLATPWDPNPSVTAQVGGSTLINYDYDYADNLLKNANGEQPCISKFGWLLECNGVGGPITLASIESNVPSFVDNINAGRYYDFVSAITQQVDEMENMDEKTKPWSTVGLLDTNGIERHANTYYVDFRTVGQSTLVSHNYTMVAGAGAAITKLRSNPPDATDVINYLNTQKGVSISSSAFVAEMSNGWTISDTSGTYKVYPVDGGSKLAIYTSKQEMIAFSVDDIRNGTITLYTYYRNIEIPLKPDVPKGADCYQLNLTFKNPTTIGMVAKPDGYAIPLGTDVEVKLQLLEYIDKDKTIPLAGEKVYIGVEGLDIWTRSPTGLSREYMFNLDEIGSDLEQQERLMDAVRYLGYREMSEAMRGAVYTKTVDAANRPLIEIRTPVGGYVTNISLINRTADYFSVRVYTWCEEPVEVGFINNQDKKSKTWTVYGSESQRKEGYVTTDAQGEAIFTFKPYGSTTITAKYMGTKASPSTSGLRLHTAGITNPLLSGEFLILALILIFAVFSYRFFSSRRIDLYSWWRDYKGKK